MNILEKIKDAELTAAKVKSDAVSKARAKARETALDAEKAAKEITDKADKNAEASRDAAKKKAADMAAEFIAEEGEKDKAFISDANKNYDKAVKFIVGEVQKL